MCRSSKGLRNVDHGQRPYSDLPTVLIEALLLFPSKAGASGKAPQVSLAFHRHCLYATSGPWVPLCDT